MTQDFYNGIKRFVWNGPTDELRRQVQRHRPRHPFNPAHMTARKDRYVHQCQGRGPMDDVQQIGVAMFWEHPRADLLPFQTDQHSAHNLAVETTDIVEFPTVPTGVIRIGIIIEGGVFNHLEWTYCHKGTFPPVASDGALGHHLLGFSNRLGRVETLGADIGAVHDGVAAIETEGIFQLIETLTRQFIATVSQPAIGLQ